jgi:GH15 family glucan-1,4-alpha-glucosidase
VSSLPIADYALLSDCRSAALVSRGGSVDWLCFPRFDSPSVFGRLLDDSAGHWSIRTVADARTSRRYAPGSMVLETQSRTPGGTALLADAMGVGPNERGHELAARSPGVLLREVRCESGTVELVTEFAPRPEYGLIRPLLSQVPGGIVAMGGADVLTLSTPIEMEIQDSLATARFTLREGEAIRFALQHRTAWEPPNEMWTQDAVWTRLVATAHAWQTWSELHRSYSGPWQELVQQSARVLVALTFRPTGAIVAAPTTSLPQAVGGVRNWDYRYAWARDASRTLEALWVAACPEEAKQYFSWMCGAAAARVSDEDLQIVFGIGGEHDLTERELTHLDGWRESRPVRVGNEAWSQRQLVVYGELLSAAYRLRDQIAETGGAMKAFLIEVADAAVARWQDPDHGIWELRGDARHFVHSKLMCWHALDCAVQLAPALGARARVPDWTAARDEIRQAILERGWNERVGAFTHAFDSDDVDASALRIPIVGFLPATDPRVRSTIEVVRERLSDERGLLHRHRIDDGLEGEEGAFLVCTFWLAHAYALAGELERAREVFERVASCANDVGLLSEEVDPATGEQLGNFPQSLSHIGLVNTARAIALAEEEARQRRGARDERAPRDRVRSSRPPV